MKNRCLTEQVVLGLVVNHMLYGRHSRCRKWRIRPAPEPEPAPWGTPPGRWWCCRPRAGHSVLLGRSAAARRHFRSPEGTGSSGTGRNGSSLPDVQNASGCSCPEWPAEWERWRVKSCNHGGNPGRSRGRRGWARVELKTTGLQIPTQAKGTLTARFACLEPKQINYKLILRLQHFKATTFYFNKKHPKRWIIIRVICCKLGEALAKVKLEVCFCPGNFSYIKICEGQHAIFNGRHLI